MILLRGPFFGYFIDAARVEGVAFHDAPDGQIPALQGTEPTHGRDAVVGAGRVKATGGRLKWRDDFLIDLE
jgi:hypothetical protein